MLQNLLKMADKEEEYNQQQKNRNKAAERKFEEITSTEKFRQNCLDKQKGCAIAFLTGNQIVRVAIKLIGTVYSLTTRGRTTRSIFRLWSSWSPRQRTCLSTTCGSTPLAT
jgi:hypothetical protein